MTFVGGAKVLNICSADCEAVRVFGIVLAIMVFSWAHTIATLLTVTAPLVFRSLSETA